MNPDGGKRQHRDLTRPLQKDLTRLRHSFLLGKSPARDLIMRL